MLDGIEGEIARVGVHFNNGSEVEYVERRLAEAYDDLESRVLSLYSYELRNGIVFGVTAEDLRGEALAEFTAQEFFAEMIGV